MKNFEVRDSFIKYFEKNNHTIVPSSSLIPENDPTLLFANAGMNQFKNLFLGLEKRNYNRAVSSQKCVRAGGKHNDLENVGFTARHHTFFEMLGNFSFGDYFKKEAIHFAWEYLTKTLSIPKDKLYVTVHLSDDEAASIWNKQEGVPTDRIFRFDQDNFWRMGDTGPCGPCTEIFYDHGESVGTIKDPFKGIASGEDRFVEIWNLVFMQYFEKSPGVMDPLPRPSVDTGSGLERVVAAMQAKSNNYDTDLFAPLIETACKKSGADYVTDVSKLKAFAEIREQTAAIRVMADHCRAAGFLLSDGAFPSNEGRGYVLRRILRRAIRFGRKLNSTNSIFPAMVETLTDCMGNVYPELKARKEFILNTVKDEEERFLSTLDKGTEVLAHEINRAQQKGNNQLSGEIVFKLYDTYGFPLDLTQLMAAEKGLKIDESGFESEMNSSKAKSKLSWKKSGIQTDEAHLIQFAQKIKTDSKENTLFVGYETLQSESLVLGLSDGKKFVSQLNENESGFVILNKSPFYAEGGGQAGDSGVLLGLKDFNKEESNLNKLDLGADEVLHHFEIATIVLNCTKVLDIFVLHVHALKGKINLGDKIGAVVNSFTRRATCANHTATHLLHSALRSVLGTHVTQAGSLVDSNRLRFDFSHNKPLSIAETAQIEKLVNSQIALAIQTQSKIMSHKEALQEGAMALFGEKYGDQVRVMQVSDFSIELCGGTHVKNTSEIQLFKIVSEGGVSSGVRRIEALTQTNAFEMLSKGYEECVKARVKVGLNLNFEQKNIDSANDDRTLEVWIEDKLQQVKSLEKEIKRLKGAQVKIEDFLKSAKNFMADGISSQLIWANLSSIEDRNVLSDISDKLKDHVTSGAVIAFGGGAESFPTVVSVTKNLSKKFPAGQLMKTLTSILGGKGGGRPDYAQGAVVELAKLNEAKKAIELHFGIAE